MEWKRCWGAEVKPSAVKPLLFPAESPLCPLQQAGGGVSALQQNRMTDPTFNKAFHSWISKHSNFHKHPKDITQHQIAAQSCCYQSKSQLSFDYQREHRKLSCITYRKLYSSIKHLFKTTEVKTQKELTVILTDIKEWLQAHKTKNNFALSFHFLLDEEINFFISHSVARKKNNYF